jgi:hypothetical protein
MFAITKEFDSAAKAVASVKITARNKKVALPADLDYSLLVKSAGRAFVVDNDALNIAAGFVQAAAPEVAQAAVAVASKGSLAASMLSMFNRDASKHAAEDKALAQSAGQKASKRASEVQNGARRPAKAGKTADVWEVTERLQNVRDGVTPTCKEVYEVLVSQDKYFNKTTCNIQYYACLKFHGWENNRG